MKGFLVAAPGSGSGKTTVAAGLMAALRKRRLRVQPFKCGPDFIDTGHHTRICERASHNLDTWMLPAETNRRIFAEACHNADIAVVEGMMGLFDGVSGGADLGSSAEMALLLNLPVVLVVDASMAARSVAALAHGFKTFDPRIRIAAVVLNLVAGSAHGKLLLDALAAYDSTLLAGWLPRREELRLKERYLGLHTAEEECWHKEQMDLAALLMEQNIPLDKLLESCDITLPVIARESVAGTAIFQHNVRIGVARDRAFCFYYEAGLEALRQQGAELVPFSPLEDSRLPEALDALYFGGGYPELYAERLSRNSQLLADVREFAVAGKPVYGECGGLIFLSRELTTLDGKRWKMTDLLPLSIEMTERLVHFGYADVFFVADGVAEKDSWLRGHSFHCSRVAQEGRVEKRTIVHYTLSGKKQEEGFAAGSVFGSYIHLHFAADPAFAARFVEQARRAAKLARTAEVSQ